MAASANFKYHGEKLLGAENWNVFRYQMAAHLRANLLIDYIDPRLNQTERPVVPVDEGDRREAALRELQRFEVTRAIILENVASSIVSQIYDKDSALEMWMYFVSQWDRQDNQSTFFIKKELRKKLKDHEDLDKHVERIIDTRQRLAALGVTYTDHELAMELLDTLPKSYKTTVDMILSQEGDLDLQAVITRLKTTATRWKSEHPQLENHDAVYRVGLADHKKNGLCYNCGGKGHIAKNCRNKENNNNGGHCKGCSCGKDKALSVRDDSYYTKWQW